MNGTALITCVAVFLGVLIGALATLAFAGAKKFRRRRADIEHPHLDTAGIPVLERLPIGAVVFDSSLSVVYQNELARLQPRLLGAVQLEEWFQNALRETLWEGRSFLREATEMHSISVRVFLGGTGLAIALLVDESARLETEAMRRDFIANASHELNTPVAAISLLSEAIRASAADAEKTQNFAESLHREVTRLANLTRDIVRLSEAQAKDALNTQEEVGVLALVGEVVENHLDLAERQQVELSFQPTIEITESSSSQGEAAIDIGKVIQAADGADGARGITAKPTLTMPPAEIYVLGDSRAVRVAVANLVENAIQYSNPGSRVGIGVEFQPQTHQVLVNVTDQGAGIPLAEQENIFKRFYRLDSARTRVAGGTGLGLAIARNIARSIGGDVTLWSRPSVGSTFTVRLPAFAPGTANTANTAKEDA